MIYAKFVILGSAVCSSLYTRTCVYSSISYKSFLIPRSSTVSSFLFHLSPTRLTCPLARVYPPLSPDRKNRTIPTIARVVCSQVGGRAQPLSSDPFFRDESALLPCNFCKFKAFTARQLAVLLRFDLATVSRIPLLRPSLSLFLPIHWRLL